MTPFLKQVAGHYLAASSAVDDIVFVFPSQRAAVFFKKYLGDVVRETSHTPIISPQALSVDNFFASLSSLRKADRITLLITLHKCYNALRKEASLPEESLDEFIFWGDMILSDFADVDKYLVDAEDIFRNIAQYKALQDDFEGLTEVQRKAMESFLGHFDKAGAVKDKFVSVWDLLGPLYKSFNAALAEQGLAYEAGIYRDLASEVASEGAAAVVGKAYPGAGKVVFCGLNALNECEKKIMHSMQNCGIAEFCWDYCSEWIKDGSNKSSFFLKDNLLAFPQAFELEKCDEVPSFSMAEVPSGVGQVKYLSKLLQNPDLPKDERTAVVLPDEGMLLPLLASLPPEVEKVNVTMGFPLSSSSFFSLMDHIAQMQLNVRCKDGTQSFYHKQVWAIAANNIFAALMDEESGKKLAKMKKQRRYYVDRNVLSGTPLLDAVFRPASGKEGVTCAELASYLLDTLDFIGKSINSQESLKDSLSLELDFAMEYSKAVTLLSDAALDVTPATWLQILRSIVRSTTIPFRGEPLCGLQIMGPLEIRALDFEHLFILNANEAVFPRHSVASSFIPASLRKAFDLPTYEYQDAVWAYYFYRMVQRPSKVDFILDSRTEGLKSGEESRYIKQLRYHFNVDVPRTVVSAPAGVMDEPDVISKDEEFFSALHARPISASALKSYLTCPAKFYYSFIKRLAPDDEVAESLDAGMVGNVFHKVMETIYKEKGSVTANFLRELLKDDARLNAMIRREICEQLGSDTVSGRDIVMERLIRKYIDATLESDIAFIEDNKSADFRILGTEAVWKGRIGNFDIKGIIDRMDSYSDGQARVVDYKTGKVLPDDVNINDANALKIVDKIFDKGKSSRPEIALQFFIYDYLLRNGHPVDGSSYVPAPGTLIMNSVYSTRKILKEKPVSPLLNEQFYAAMQNSLIQLLAEIENPDFPLDRCNNTSVCEYCDFKTICAR